MSTWTAKDIPDQTDRTAIVTGANTGIGFETARMLAHRGANVVLANRDPDKGKKALEAIRRDAPKASVELGELDLADLDSVARFAERFATDHQRLDLLIHNAGVMVPPLGRTRQGFELQFGTNHLGHFALAGKLLPLLMRTPEARLVVVSSGAQNAGRIDFSDLNWEGRPYNAWRAYAQSKLANMMFALELDRRVKAAGVDLRVTAAHPGWTATDLQRTAGVTRMLNPIFAMKPADGALPTLRAAVDPAAGGGSYWGPSRFFELNGPPAPARIPPHAKDAAVSAELWAASERLTGISYPLAAGPVGAA